MSVGPARLHRRGRHWIGLPATLHLTENASSTAFRYQPLLGAGARQRQSDSGAERLDRRDLGALLRLTPLARDIVDAIPDGRQAEGMTLPALIRPFLAE